MYKNKILRFSILLIILCIFIPGTLFGCKGEISTITETRPSEKVIEQKTTQEKIKSTTVIRFASCETAPASMDFLKEQIAEYESLNPNVKISPEFISIDNQFNYLATNIAGDNAPNIMDKAYAYLAAEFADRLLELDDIIAEIGENNFYTGGIFKQNEHYYFLPYTLSGLVMYVREDLFEKYNVKIPETTEEWLKAAEQLTLDTDGDGEIDLYGTTISAKGGGNTPSAIFWQTLMWQQGYSQFDKDYNPTLDNPGVVNALKVLKDVSKFCPPGIVSYDWVDLMNAYATGNVASTFYMGRFLSYLRDNSPELLKVTKAVHFPIIENGVRCTFGEYVGYCAFKSNDENQNRIAKDFIKFIYTEDKLARNMLNVPGHFGPVLKNQDLTTFYNDSFVKENKENIDFIFNEISNYNMSESLDAGAKIVNGNMVPEEGVAPTKYIMPVSTSLAAYNLVEKIILDEMTPEEGAKWVQSIYKEIVDSEKEKES